MALSIDQYLQLIALDLYNDPNKDLWIQMAKERTGQCFFGANYNQAVALRAAHMWALSVSRPSGDSGIISSKKEGDLSISYGAGGGASDSDLGLTHYGQQLESLIKSSRASITVLGTPNNSTICST